jgi:hypothetical protein
VGQTISIKIALAHWGDGVVARQLPWTHNLIILNQSKRPEDGEFYLQRSASSGASASWSGSSKPLCLSARCLTA